MQVTDGTERWLGDVEWRAWWWTGECGGQRAVGVVVVGHGWTGSPKNGWRLVIGCMPYTNKYSTIHTPRLFLCTKHQRFIMASLSPIFKTVQENIDQDSAFSDAIRDIVQLLNRQLRSAQATLSRIHSLPCAQGSRFSSCIASVLTCKFLIFWPWQKQTLPQKSSRCATCPKRPLNSHTTNGTTRGLAPFRMLYALLRNAALCLLLC